MNAVLKANERKGTKGSSLRRLRKEGNIPAVVYGKDVQSTPIYFSSTDFLKTIRESGRNGVISLEVGGSKHNVMLTEYQEDYIKNEVIHADFLVVDKDSKVHTTVRIDLVGDSAGVRDGGVLQQPVHEINITGTPGSIPEAIELDITDLKVGENLMVSDIKPENYEINDDESTVIASILPPKVEEEIDSGEEQEPGEPKNAEGRETEANEE
ncbi:50S ribosomal protein L25/general stress protein Ctc [Bacillus sp. REN3]|uniref:50S ribosomal protein L25/general stress protein Ctc n=1 Tax=Bacillus sp. REN3 TaxID=2802440 RepID=UPI001AEDE1CB|nr:50S ribosomal protein L25/general stress protein Ctc [Bacillus sp. REN3]